MEIEQLIRRWADAVHAGDLDTVLADHGDDIVMFDVPPPHEGVRGLAAYEETWPPFFAWQATGAGVLALAVFCSSHVGEIVRGALQAIPRGQTEAAKAIGLTFAQTFVEVLLPQAGRLILPAWVNVAAEIVKASTLLSIIGVAELLLATQEIIARTFMSLPFYFFAGFLYFCINFGIERLGRAVEKRLALSA